jgi:hypothetical protein
MHIGHVLEMAESSSDKYAYENKVAERFGGQMELELVVPTPSVIPPPDLDDSELLKPAWSEDDDKATRQ